MHPNLTNVSVRLELHTLKTIDTIVARTKQHQFDYTPTNGYRPYSRSELIRHAIKTGLDVLTHQTPIELLEP